MSRCNYVWAAVALLVGAPARACTSILANLGTTTFTTHTADCPDCDFRLAKVKSRTLPTRGRETVMLYRQQYPREVSDRSATWNASRLEGPTAAHVAFWRSAEFQKAQNAYETDATVLDAAAEEAGGRVGGEASYAYYEALFAIANEAGVTMGESTCYARLTAGAGGDGPGFRGARYDVSALTRVALERCGTARCAVKIMGALAEREGYYAADASALSEAGESLSVADGREAWLFHILPANATGRASAVWAAMKLGDGEVTVCANAFVIRGVPSTDGVGADGREYLASGNLESAARAHGLPVAYTAANEVDFVATYGGGQDPFNLKRQWRVYDRLAPSLALPDDAEIMEALHARARAEGVAKRGPLGTLDEYPAGIFDDLPRKYRDDAPEDAYYPKAVAIEALSSPLDARSQVDAANAFLALCRDVYAGTKFDASLDPRSGGFGDPEEFPGGPRRISIQRTAFWHVGMASTLQPAALSTVLRFGQYAPHAGPAVPLFVAGDAEPPVELSTGSLFAAPVVLDVKSAEPVPLFWAAALLGGWTRAYYRVAQPAVEELRDAVERRSDAALVAAIAAAEDDDGSGGALEGRLAAANAAAARAAVDAWIGAFPNIARTYRDGYVVGDRCAAEATADTSACGANPTSAFDISVKGMTFPDWYERLYDTSAAPPAAEPDNSLALVAIASFACGALLASLAALFAKRSRVPEYHAPGGQYALNGFAHDHPTRAVP